MNAFPRPTKLAVLVALALAPVALAAPTQSRDLKGYSKIQLNGSLDLEIKEGSGYAFELTAPENEQSIYTTEVRGDTLIIGTKSGFHFNLGHAIARITVPELQSLQINGSGEVAIRSLSHVHDLDVSIHGSGDVQLEGSLAKASVAISGSGDVTFGSGTAGSLDVRVQGSGDVDAKALTAQSAQVDTHGSGDVSVTVNGGPARFSSSGSGDIDWYGSAQQVESHSSGSGDITHH